MNFILRGPNSTCFLQCSWNSSVFLSLSKGPELCWVYLHVGIVPIDCLRWEVERSGEGTQKSISAPLKTYAGIIACLTFMIIVYCTCLSVECCARCLSIVHDGKSCHIGEGDGKSCPGFGLGSWGWWRLFQE